MSELAAGAIRKVDSHEWEREAHEHYVEPEWCSQRLFEVEPFIQEIWDPACGFGRIAESARDRGHAVLATDIVDRGYARAGKPRDFFTETDPLANIASNPPFDIFRHWAEHSLKLARHKVALIWLVRTLPAARWLEETPLKRILLLTPRPSMPPGYVIARGEKPGGGKQDFCWLIWEHGYCGKPETGWLRRDRTSAVDAGAGG